MLFAVVLQGTQHQVGVVAAGVRLPAGVSTGREMLPGPFGRMRWVSGEAKAKTVHGMASHVRDKEGRVSRQLLTVSE